MRTLDVLDFAFFAAFGVLLMLAPFRQYRIIERAVSMLALVMMPLIIAYVARDWWIGEWEIGPLLTPVRAIVPDGHHPDDDALQSSGDPRFYLGLYYGLAASAWGRFRDWRQSRRRLQNTPEPPGFRARLEESMAAARRIFERRGEDPDAVAADRFFGVRDAVYRAIRACERRLQSDPPPPAGHVPPASTAAQAHQPRKEPS